MNTGARFKIQNALLISTAGARCDSRVIGLFIEPGVFLVVSVLFDYAERDDLAPHCPADLRWLAAFPRKRNTAAFPVWAFFAARDEAR